MLAISLPWTKEDHVDIARMLQSVKDMGLDAIEFGYTLTHQQVETMIPLMKTMGLRAASVHNFSPVPNDRPSPRHVSNYYRLTAVDEDERRSAVQWTNHSVDTAVRTGAKVVVIHAGMIELGDPRSPELLNLYKEGRADTAEYEAVRSHLLKEREQIKGPYLQALNNSLDAVMRYAQDQGIKIGLETRYYPTEIPNFSEIGELLDKYRSYGMGYWHDVGHAEVNGRLGITAHEQYLRSYQRDLIGVHLHGVKGLRDHNAPFCGDFDLAAVLPYFQKDTIKVIESRLGSFDELVAAVKKLKEVF
ncbi:MAG: TIM barrel protein [Candidatus Omnitrophica bacterium]|nr:TIM barrel protein [Candidatus Omnitrophota bacterium]